MTEWDELETLLTRVAQVDEAIRDRMYDKCPLAVGDRIVRRDMDHEDGCERRVVYVNEDWVCYEIAPRWCLEAVQRYYVRPWTPEDEQK